MTSSQKTYNYNDPDVRDVMRTIGQIRARRVEGQAEAKMPTNLKKKPTRARDGLYGDQFEKLGLGHVAID